jgi:hypothetical protein
VIETLLDYYRIPAELFGDATTTTDCGSADTGFFQFGSKNLCYGKSQCGVSGTSAAAKNFDASTGIVRDSGKIQLPFDPAEVVNNLRLEHYKKNLSPGGQVFDASEPVRKLYYLIREGLPVAVRRELQKLYFRKWKELTFPAWPVDFTVETLHEDFLKLLMEAAGTDRIPFVWFWPDGAPNCLIMTHDVETSGGRDYTADLMDIDDKYGIKSSFQVIPEGRYDVSNDYVRLIRARGCEFNVHDLTHDGRLYLNRETFLARAKKINEYIRKFDACGFRAGVMYRNLDWYDAYDFSYDMSVPNVAHLEPQRGGCCTVFPYFVGKILEIPLTTCQDYSLFHILNDYSIDLWKTQLDMIGKRNGLMSFITHPDYLIDARARKVYETLLAYLRRRIDHEKIWATLPRELDQWWRARSQMKMVRQDNGWEVVGPEAERARIAYAVNDGNRIRYEVMPSSIWKT